MRVTKKGRKALEVTRTGNRRRAQFEENAGGDFEALCLARLDASWENARPSHSYGVVAEHAAPKGEQTRPRKAPY